MGVDARTREEEMMPPAIGRTVDGREVDCKPRVYSQKRQDGRRHGDKTRSKRVKKSLRETERLNRRRASTGGQKKKKCLA